MKKYCCIVIFAWVIVTLVACSSTYEVAPPQYNNNPEDAEISHQLHTSEFKFTPETVQVADIIHFGNHEWKVLEVFENNTALLITKDIVDKKPFHIPPEDEIPFATWETSDIRKYLNSTFLDTFGQEERKLILPKRTPNHFNQWLRGGNDTIDYIFLLSVQEVVNYFGDSGILKDIRPPHPYGIPQWLLDDQYNYARKAVGKYGAERWWLRSLGFDYDFGAFVFEDGIVAMDGQMVTSEIGVRPALLLDLGKIDIPDKLLENGPNFSIYQISFPPDPIIYRYEISNEEGDIVLSRTAVWPRPRIEYIDEDTLMISMGFDDNIMRAQFYSIDKDILSTIFETVFLLQDEKIAHLGTTDLGAFVMIVQNIFDPTKYYKTFSVENIFGRTYLLADAIRSVEYLDDGNLKIVYFSGIDYHERILVHQP